MTVYLVDGSMSRNDSRKASAGAVNNYALLEYYGYRPFSVSFAALPLLDGSAGKSRLTTRGFMSSTILKVPARQVLFSTIHIAAPLAL